MFSSPVRTNRIVPISQPVQIPPFQLQGVVLREPAPSALINSRTYFLGDFVDDGKVMAIDTNAVVLEWRGLKVILRPPK